MTMTFSDFLNWERSTHDTIDFKKSYVDAADGDLLCGLALSSIIFWYLPNQTGETKLRVEKEGHHWLAIPLVEWWDRCRLTLNQITYVQKKLILMGLIEKRVFKFDRQTTVHLRIIEHEFLRRINLVLGTQDQKQLFEINDLEYSSSRSGNFRSGKSMVLDLEKTGFPSNIEYQHRLLSTFKGNGESNNSQPDSHDFKLEPPKPKQAKQQHRWKDSPYARDPEAFQTKLLERGFTLEDSKYYFDLFTLKDQNDPKPLKYLDWLLTAQQWKLSTDRRNTPSTTTRHANGNGRNFITKVEQVKEIQEYNRQSYEKLKNSGFFTGGEK